MKTQVKKDAFRRLFPFLRPYRIGLFTAIFCIVVSSIANGFAPYLLGKATDALVSLLGKEMSTEVAVRRFVTILLALGAVYLLFAVFKYASSVLLARVSQQSIRDLREAVDRKFRHLPIRYFDEHSYGDILSRITNDVDMISNSIQQSLEQLISGLMTILFVFVMMFLISPTLTLIGFVTIPASFFFSMNIAKRSREYFQSQQATLGKLNGYVEERYTGHHLVSAFGAEEKTIEQFEKLNEELYGYAQKANFISASIMPVTQLMSNFGYVAVTVVSSWLVIRGRMSIGMIQSFIQYLRQFSHPISMMAQITNVIQSTAAAATRVFEFLDETEETPEPTDAALPDQSNRIEFREVRFGYQPDQVLMKNVNVKVPSGAKVAIVGPTGAGKTTLTNLLLRFYDVDGGKILVGGTDIREMRRKDLRALFGMVLQDTWLFAGTIMQNLRYGNLHASEEEVFRAARAARADAFIRALPDGYQFRLQEGAANLAQGERQLLTIARAILSNSPIMILDEATSSVDTRTEVLIQEAMRTLMKGRTSFIIAHRLSTIRDADTILYMEHGDILESGSHEMLLAAGGKYAALYNSQFAEENEAS